MPIARDGWREILLSTIVLGGLAALGAWLFWPAAIPFAIVWVWAISFFRDPRRERTYAPGEMCSAADGTVTEITELPHYEPISGPAVRIGIFLSIFNVHANRSPCRGRVRSLEYQEGKFLDARDPESGAQNESNTIVLDPLDGVPGPVVVRQIAGLLARRIVCHGGVGTEWRIGERFGMLKFGSRTEIVIPKTDETEILVSLGDKIQAGLTIVARQPTEAVADGPS